MHEIVDSPAESVLSEMIGDVSARIPASFFVGVSWLQACLHLWQGRAEYLVAKVGAQPTAWALIGSRTECRHRMLRVSFLALNQSGIESLDQPWIECNGFFGAAREHFGQCLEDLLAALERRSDWDELRLPGLREAERGLAERLATARGMSVHAFLEAPTYRTDLSAVRSCHGGDLLAALSANTRQQLRRSRRQIERALGPLALDRARTAGEAVDWLRATGPLHRARWGDSGPLRSGFANPAFVGFHEKLIELAFGRGEIHYLRLRAGDRVVAYLYNFALPPTMSFYLSGIDYSVDERFRPGMLAHQLAMEQALQSGFDDYDFLAGDARYKVSLSTDRGMMTWLVLRRPRLKFRLEGLARAVAGRWRGRAAPREAVGTAPDLPP